VPRVLCAIPSLMLGYEYYVQPYFFQRVHDTL
jgi:hypothetical protein